MTKRLMSRLAAGAAIGSAALLLAAPAAAAAQSSASASPATVAPGGQVRISASCANSTSANVNGINLGMGTINMKQGARPDQYFADLTVPRSQRPGTYDIQVNCSGGDAPGARLTVRPGGGVAGGTGLEGDNAALIAAGAGTLAAAGIGGFWLLRRREADAPAA